MVVTTGGDTDTLLPVAIIVLVTFKAVEIFRSSEVNEPSKIEEFRAIFKVLIFCWMRDSFELGGRVVDTFTIKWILCSMALKVEFDACNLRRCPRTYATVPSASTHFQKITFCA